MGRGLQSASNYDPKAFGLTGSVQNLDDGRVGIIAEGDEDMLNTFLDAIWIKDGLIDVDDIEMEYADVTGDFNDFYKLAKDGDIDDPLDKRIMYPKELLDVMKTGFAGMSEAMRGEYPETKEEMQSGFGNPDSKRDLMIGKQDETATETRGLREDMKTCTDRKFGEIESELDVIKSALRGCN